MWFLVEKKVEEKSKEKRFSKFVLQPNFKMLRPKIGSTSVTPAGGLGAQASWAA